MFFWFCTGRIVFLYWWFFRFLLNIWRWTARLSASLKIVLDPSNARLTFRFLEALRCSRGRLIYPLGEKTVFVCPVLSFYRKISWLILWNSDRFVVFSSAFLETNDCFFAIFLASGTMVKRIGFKQLPFPFLFFCVNISFLKLCFTNDFSNELNIFRLCVIQSTLFFTFVQDFTTHSFACVYTGSVLARVLWNAAWPLCGYLEVSTSHHTALHSGCCRWRHRIWPDKKRNTRAH